MLRILGSMLIISASAMLGMYAARELDETQEELGYLHRLISMLQGEIRYSRDVLSHIFLKLSREAKEPYRAWLTQMGDRMEARMGISTAQIWKEAAETNLKKLPISRQEWIRLVELGEYLGGTDLQMQMSHLDRYKEELMWTIQERRKGIEEKKKLCRCIGLAGGIFIAILLI